MKVKNTFLVLTLMFSINVQAQTVKWCIHPEYAEIDYVCEDLFKCVDFSGKWHFIDLNGNVLIPNVNADAITDFVEGYAIVHKGNKIVGFIAEAQGHDFQPVVGDYSITQYDFFSGGLLVVADSKGKMGYMDAKDNLTIPCKYERARPFKQGYASVEVGKKNVYYINPQGKTGNPEGFHGGNLTKGSSFNENGEAVVANYQDYAIIGTNMQVRRKIAYTPDLPVRSCDYAYSEGDEDGCVEPSDFDGEEDKRIERYSENGAFGYRWKNGSEGDKLPAQFSEAMPFYDGRAIVSKNGKYGVLSLADGKFSAIWPDELRVYPDGKCSNLQFALEVPSSLERDQINLEFDEGNGSYKKSTLLEYGFLPNFRDGAKKCTFRAKAMCDGLLLWEAAYNLDIDYITIDIKNPAVTTEFADENDNQTVKATITNTSNVDVVVEATLKVDGQSVPFKGTLKPKQSKALTKTIKVTETKSVSATVTVKADGHDCGSKTSIVSLKI